MSARSLGVVSAMILGLLAVAHRADAAPIQLSVCQTLSTEGAYVVTQNLGNTTGSCLELGADRITIDLNGFSVSGAGGGIASAGNATRRHTVIRNGGVGGGPVGINLPTSEATVVERVRASGTVWSILLGAEAVVKDCVVVDVAGISVGPRSLVVGNIASDGAGISAGGGSAIKDNVVNFNGGDGLVVGAGSTVSGNTVVSNNGRGIFAKCPSAIVGNLAVDNDGGDIVLSGAGCNRAHNVPKP